MRNTDTPTVGPALDQARAFAEKYDMLPSGCVVLCAVSGGADSMCLLHWLTRREDLSVHVGHFNHRLRGAESDRDEVFVRDWCQTHDIPFHTGTADVRAEARQRRMGIEETARALRYGFLSKLAIRLGADRIATAHNAGDNAETLLLHLIRGTGLQGLAGIDPVQWKYIRPLLTTSRAEIEAYLNTWDVPHVEDSTNADDAYTRNRIRHQLIPLLEEMNPGFVRRTADAAHRLRQDNDCLNAMARELFRTADQVEEDGDLTISIRALSAAPDPVALRCIRLLLEEANEGDGNCSAAHLESVLRLCRSQRPSGQVHLPHALTARREYDRLILTHAPPPAPLASFSPVQGENPIPGTDWVLLLDAPPWPGLVVRPRQAGDRITLPHRPGKRLKELFIDEKLPRRERDRLPLAADSGGVLALAGFGPNTAHPRHQAVRFINLKEKEEKHHGK